MLVTTEWVTVIARVFELAGVLVIVVGFVIAAVRSAALLPKGGREAAYTSMRAVFGRAVLLGLEVLVAADIIRTVALQPTLSNLAVLAGLVLIRTFLSWSLTVEIDGRWPWQAARTEAAPEGEVT